MDNYVYICVYVCTRTFVDRKGASIQRCDHQFCSGDVTANEERRGGGEETCSASSRTSSISLRTMGQGCSEGKFLSETGSWEASIPLGNESCVSRSNGFFFPPHS